MLSRLPVSLGPISAILAIGVLACGTDAVGVDACRQIEEARCRHAPTCQILIEPPHRTSGTDVSECIRFYNDACLHGLAGGNDPGPTAVSACVAAINAAPATAGGCAVVTNPETASACAWLGPPPSSADAAADTDGGSADASTE
jgi:hypothetical protein